MAGHPTLGVGWLNLAPKYQLVRVDPGMTITLLPVTSIQGRYVTPDDKPLGGVVMNLYRIHDLNPSNFTSNLEFDLQVSQLTPRDTTKPDGSFILSNLPKDLVASIGGAAHQDGCKAVRWWRLANTSNGAKFLEQCEKH